LVSTPRSDYRVNTTSTSNVVTIEADGSAVVRNSLRSQGEAASFFQYLYQLKDEEKKETLVKHLLYKAPDELELTANGEADDATYAVNRVYDRLYDFKAGNKYFFPLCVNKLATEPVKPFRRETDFLFSYPYTKKDTTVFQLPEGFVLEAVPASKVIQTEGSFYKRSCGYNREKNTLTISSELLLKEHVIPAAQYQKLVTFFRDVAAMEEENFVLVAGQKAGF
jgi:hypothetical protein